MYAYLLLLINNYDNDHNLADSQTCIMRAKFITKLFRQFSPNIDNLSAKDLETIFNEDDDYIRLYILTKLSYADMLLNAPQVLRIELGETADLHEINKIYTVQILQRFSDTRHLSTSQIKNIKSAIVELNNKVTSDEDLEFLTEDFTDRGMARLKMYQDELNEAAKLLMTLKKAPTRIEKRSNEVLDDQTLHGNRFRFTANINVNVNVQVIINGNSQSCDKKQRTDDSASLDL